MIEATIEISTVPAHLAIIMDGNRRWARERGLPAAAGHAEGANALYRTVQAAAELGIKELTVFGFSTENWFRTPEEVEALVAIVGDSAIRFREAMLEEGVRMQTIGDLSRFPPAVREALETTCAATRECERIELTLAVSYGGRNDIVRAAQAFAADVKAGLQQPEALDEALFASYLETAGLSEPDMVVRTSGESRLSNFLIWQVSYSELMVQEILWPDYDRGALVDVIAEYQTRERRHGN
jgi:undecaprenyl diphosphate synthase